MSSFGREGIYHGETYTSTNQQWHVYRQDDDEATHNALNDDYDVTVRKNIALLRHEDPGEEV